MKSLIHEIPTWRLKSDEELWRMFRRGDRHAFATLYHRYFRILFQYCIRISPDEDTVKDCLQDLFADIWKKRATLSQPESVKAYLLSSIRRKVIRYINRDLAAKDRFTLFINNEPVHCKEDQLIENQLEQEQQTLLKKALNALTKRQNEAIYLKFYCNLSYKQISELMCISVDSIYNLISKSIDILQAELNRSWEYKH